MKKKILALLLGLSLIFVLAACGKSSGGSSDSTTLVVGASPVPHAEILKKAQPVLKKKGIDLKIKVFQDYVLPNKALATKQIDANYFQHTPFLEEYNKQNKTNLVSAGKIHIEPFAIYSRKYKKVSDIKDGSTIQISNNTAEQGRILMLLESAGLVKIKPGVNKISATIKDIENPKHLRFLSPIDPALLPKVYQHHSADLFAINTNYALQAKLNPVKDSLILENSKSPYANLIAVRKGDENRKAIRELVKVLHSKEIQDYIKSKYKGAIIPVND
ncbi:ABC transporter substrate-binding protein [Sporolactobacillus sp. THM7-4]|nr:ABC transporter substrate-binding protein [Sporolactobacillus sp. THM7-4]